MWVLGIILPFVSAMVITALVHPVIVKMALKKNMTDAPDYRKLQKQPVPVMGGLAVFFGVVVGAGVTSMFFNTYALFTCFSALGNSRFMYLCHFALLPVWESSMLST